MPASPARFARWRAAAASRLERSPAKLTSAESANFVQALFAPVAPNAALRGAFSRYRREILRAELRKKPALPRDPGSKKWPRSGQADLLGDFEKRLFIGKWGHGARNGQPCPR
jgi:hypothetical protein